MEITTEGFVSERLRAVPLAVGHAAEMAGVLAGPALYAVIGGAPPSAADLRRRYAAMAAGPPDGYGAWCNWVLDDGTGLVGTVQATVAPSGAGHSAEAEADLAWIIGLPWQRRGYATEAARAMAGWLAGAGVTRARAMVAPGHTPSERVARACGLAPSQEWSGGERVWAGAIGGR
ncbi:GNAT family N-acetyltransferase [Nocardiopsis coralliicola]